MTGRNYLTRYLLAHFAPGLAAADSTADSTVDAQGLAGLHAGDGEPLALAEFLEPSEFTECEECGHAWDTHGLAGCEYTHDLYTAGYAPMAVQCPCKRVK